MVWNFLFQLFSNCFFNSCFVLLFSHCLWHQTRWVNFASYRYCLSPPQRHVCVTERLGRELGDENLKRAGDRKRKIGNRPLTCLFTASQGPSLAYHFLISLFYHVYCNAQQEPLLFVYWGLRCFLSIFFLMDTDSLKSCASHVTSQKQFRTVSVCNWQWKCSQFFMFFCVISFWTKNFRFCETAHLPLPWPKINTNFSLRQKKLG